jgi:hypothetical protein
MHNAKLMLQRVGRRFLVVAVGDTNRGPMKGMSRIGGQPNKGHTRDEAIKLAAGVDLPALGKYLSGITGSYVSPSIRERLEEIPGAKVIPSPAPKDIEARAENLLDRRRAALAQLAEIDRQISNLLGPEGVDLVAKATAPNVPTVH